MTEPKKQNPPGWPRISSCLYYADAHAAIAWLGEAFGFEVRLLVEGGDGEVVHSELTYGDGVIMVGDGKAEHASWNRKNPSDLGGANTQSLMVYVDDIEAHHDRAVAAGAQIVKPIELHDYGDAYWADRGYGARDYEGHVWWFAERVRDPGAK